MESIFEVANYFLSLERMSHRKLQKLCYYAQAWHLAVNGACLMDTWFEAWKHGPVSPRLWHEYKDWHDLTIMSYDSGINFHNDRTALFLDKVYQLYGHYSGDQLEELACGESPWKDARYGRPLDAACTGRIPDESMRSFYKSLLK